MIFYLGKWLSQDDFQSTRLVNKHWSEAGRSFITKLSICSEAEDSPPLRYLLKHFGDETFHQLRRLKITPQFKNGGDSLSQFTKLRSLDISCWSAGTQQFAALQFLVNLTSLSITGRQFNDAGMQNLSSLTNLSKLRLEWCNLTEASVPYLTKMTNLSHLSLSGLQAQSKACLHSLRDLKKMIRLDLSGMYLSAEALGPLSNLTNLTDLNLSTNDITSESLEQISGLCHVNKLNLSRTRVDNKGLMVLTSLQRLKELNLSGSYVDDQGLRYLTRLRFLAILDLSDNFMLCSNNLEHLMPLTTVASLRWINLQRTQANETGVKEFVDAMQPRKVIVHY